MNEPLPLIRIVCDPDIPPGRAFLMPPDGEMGRILAHAPDIKPEDLAKMMAFAVEGDL